MSKQPPDLDRKPSRFVGGDSLQSPFVTQNNSGQSYDNQERPSSNNPEHVGITLNCRAARQNPHEGWLDAHESILQGWKVSAFIDMWLQNKSADYYRTVENLVTFPVIILSSASSISLFAARYDWTKYLVSGANIIVGLLTAMGRQLQCNEKCQEHSSMAGKYQSLIRAIDTCLDLPKHMRPNPNVLIEKLGSEIDGLSSSHLTPPYFVVKSFESTYGPIHQLMFGDDIIQLLKKDVKNRKIVKTIQQKDEMNQKSSQDLKKNPGKK